MSKYLNNILAKRCIYISVGDGSEGCGGRQVIYLQWTWMVIISLLEFQKYNPKKMDIQPKWRDAPIPTTGECSRIGLLCVGVKLILPQFAVASSKPKLLRDRQVRSQILNSSNVKYIQFVGVWLLSMLIIIRSERFATWGPLRSVGPNGHFGLKPHCG